MLIARWLRDGSNVSYRPIVTAEGARFDVTGRRLHFVTSQHVTVSLVAAARISESMIGPTSGAVTAPSTFPLTVMVVDAKFTTSALNSCLARPSFSHQFARSTAR